MPATMKVIEISQYGDADVLRLAERSIPRVRPGHILIRVEAAGLNNGDLMQRRGLYPPPPGETDIPGLEAAGTVAAVGDDVGDWSIGVLSVRCWPAEAMANSQRPRQASACLSPRAFRWSKQPR